MAHLTLKQLLIFIEVAKYLSISSAARYLHVSQPGISRQIRNMENQFGRPLFEQLGKKLHMTETGSLLLPQAKKIIDEVDLFKALLTSQDPEKCGILKLSVSIPLQEIALKILGNFYEQYPFINFELLDGDHNAQTQFLHENKVDCCLGVNPLIKPDLLNELVEYLPMSFFMSPRHRLANTRNITAQMLSEERYIVCETGSPNYIKIQDLFKLIKAKTPRTIQVGDQNKAKYAVKANLGISILPRHMLELEFKQKLLVPFSIRDFPEPLAGIYWTQHADKQLPSLTQIFKDFLFQSLRKYKGPRNKRGPKL